MIVFLHSSYNVMKCSQFTKFKSPITNCEYLLCNLRCILECNLINCIRRTEKNNWRFFALLGAFSVHSSNLWANTNSKLYCVSQMSRRCGSYFFTWQQPTKPFRQLLAGKNKSENALLCSSQFSIPMINLFSVFCTFYLTGTLPIGFRRAAVLAFSNMFKCHFILGV